ncbi:MAG: V-type ATP synthase subunit B [Candidatus Improbicoccus pseudotrichonymphae]|uniref:V-type ATP synthase beta chain n=1 Tax=Candidatus Improbicoccus pseudotrichonymphae TaxID=3033792 RepID=A0AA48L0U4_9FIRM|nr:MAG: V-type ATP synthase subunit B [Candidatus Improbicoccus pseudotrichonymphae]
MIIEYRGVQSINGPLIAVSGIKDKISYGEMAQIYLDSGQIKTGRVIQIDGDIAVIQVFEGTKLVSLKNTGIRFAGESMRITLSEEILGRVFNGICRPIDGLGEVFGNLRRDINGQVINPVSRTYPRNYINTGISSIDVLSTLIRGQKLPIFSGSGMKHNELAVRIVNQSKIQEYESEENNFAIVFAAIGVKKDVASYFEQEFRKSAIIEKVVMFINTSDDSVMERILTPRCALTVAEYLAFDLGMHVLVILTDMTSYCEALREYSSSKEEIPSRKGYPGYLYSDLSSIYERAGILKNKPGSITQLPILTMPNDDITHPIPDLTGYITEGQIVLSRDLESKSIGPAVSVLASLSRLMKDGIGEEFTREDHSSISNQLFSSYSKVQEIRSLASIIGKEDLAKTDKLYLEFGRLFEEKFIKQGENESRTMEESLDLGWKLVSILPKSELERIDSKILDKYYVNNLEQM